MSSYPAGFRYTKDHEWVSVKDGIATVGITHHAQDALGDVVYVELPKPGSQVVQGATFGTVESVKAVSELYAPVSGEVLEVNGALNDEPGAVNGDPHGAGWMIKVRLATPSEVDALMDSTAYAELVAS